MESHVSACGNVPSTLMLNTPLIPQTTLSVPCDHDLNPEVMGCNVINAVKNPPCKDIQKKNRTYKTIIHNRPIASPIKTGFTTTSYNKRVENEKSIGSGQSTRRRLIPQEYPSRLYYASSDYTCREEFFNLDDGRLFGSPSPTQALQLPVQHENQYTFAQHPFPAQSNHHQQQYFYRSVNHLQDPGQIHASQTGSCPTVINNNVKDEAISCDLHNKTKTCFLAPTQAFEEKTNEQEVSATSMGSLIVPSQPLIYAVHRVVATAQIQSAVGNSFTSSSSLSSVVSALRQDPELISSPISGGLYNESHKHILNTMAGSFPSTSIECHNTSELSGNGNQFQNPKSKNNLSKESLPTSQLSNSNVTMSLTNTDPLSAPKLIPPAHRALQNVLPTCVFLMSRVAVHMEIEGTSQCPTQVMLAAALGCEELGIANKLLAQSIFGLWMVSKLLEIQLKSHHRPYVVRMAWKKLLQRCSNGNSIEKRFDEPLVMLKRSVFFLKRDEEKIKDHRIIELLYEEAKQNVLSGRYVMEPVHSLMLGGLQARIELGPFNHHSHNISFFRENQLRFLPQHVAKSSNWAWLPISQKNSPEAKLFEQFKRVPQPATTRKLMRKYLEFCWALPFYGSAFFTGQIEQPVRGPISFVSHRDIEILIAVNERGIFILDPCENTLLVGLKYEKLSWDFAKPEGTDENGCQPCIFLQFDAVENGMQLTKLMQVFSKQAAMIDSLIHYFTEQVKKRKQNFNSPEQLSEEPYPIQNNGNGVLCNKLSRLTLATFDEEGRCISQMGSLSISY